MLAIPTIDLMHGEPPTLPAVRRARRRLLGLIAGSFGVLAYLLSSNLIALGEAHMSTRAERMGSLSPLALGEDLLMVVLFLGAAWVLYRALTGYLDLCVCEDSKVCRVVYAVCRDSPQADRYRQAVVRQARGFLTAEVDAFYELCPPDRWNRNWPDNLREQIRSSTPLAA